MEENALIWIGAPEKSEFGVDLKSFEIGERFRGVHGVPQGLRFVHYKPGPRYGMTIDRFGGQVTRGMFVWVENDQVLAYRWDEKLEEYQMVDREDRERIVSAVDQGQFHGFLGPYDFDLWTTWTQLTCFWNTKILERVGISLNKVVVGQEQEEDEVYCSPKFTVLPSLNALSRVIRAHSTIGNEDVTMRKYLMREDGTGLVHGQQLTALHMDPSELVLKCLEFEYAGNFQEFLGEIQLAFILFVYLACLPALDFWKTSVHLVCSCIELKKGNRAEDVKMFIEMLRHQFFLLPPDLFKNDILENPFLKEALAATFDVDGCSDSIREEVHTLKQIIAEKYGKSVLNRLETLQDETENDFIVSSIASSHELLATNEDDDNDDTMSMEITEKPVKKSRERMAWMLG